MPEHKPTAGRRALRWVLGACVAAVAVMIFLFSAQNAERSTETSNFIVQLVKDVLSGMLAVFLGHEPAAAELSFFIRKLGHFSEFMLLCFFLRLYLQTFDFKRRSLTAWSLSTVYAMTDELHQLFSEGRAAQLRDVMIDSSGAAAGLCAALLLLLCWHTLRKGQGKASS